MLEPMGAYVSCSLALTQRGDLVSFAASTPVSIGAHGLFAAVNCGTFYRYQGFDPFQLIS